MGLLIILLKINSALAIFYLLYRVLLRRLTFYNFNRVYLLLAILISFVWPFVRLSKSVQMGLGQFKESVGMPATYLLQTNNQQLTAVNWVNILLGLYWSGVVVMSILFLIQLFSLLLLFRQSRSASILGESVKLLRDETASFSFFKTIFINPIGKGNQEINSILSHEKIHVRQWHSLDVMIAELKRIFCWFNPGAWFMLAAIRENLEYIADRKVLQQGADRKAYQYNLLSLQFNTPSPRLTNNYNFSNLKIRITMMNKKRTNDVHLLKYLLAVPVVAGLALFADYSHAQNKKERTVSVKVDGNSIPVEDFKNLSDQDFELKHGIDKSNIPNVAVLESDSLVTAIIEQTIKEMDIPEPPTPLDFYNLEDDMEHATTRIFTFDVENSDDIDSIVKDALTRARHGLSLARKDLPAQRVALEKAREELKKATIEIKEMETSEVRADVQKALKESKTSIEIAKKSISADRKELNQQLQSLKVQLSKLNAGTPLSFDGASVLHYKGISDSVTYIQIVNKQGSKKKKILERIDAIDAPYKVYPNPASKSFYVQTNASNDENNYALISLAGKKPPKIVNKGRLEGKTKIDVSGLSNGIYILQLDIEGKKYSSRISVVNE